MDGTSGRGSSMRPFGLVAAAALLLFSIAGTKLATYALPGFAFAALAVRERIAGGAAERSRAGRVAVILSQVSFALLGAFALALPQVLERLPEWIGAGAPKEPALRRKLELGAAPYLMACV